jgi:hypothetical protein
VQSTLGVQVPPLIYSCLFVLSFEFHSYHISYCYSSSDQYFAILNKNKIKDSLQFSYELDNLFFIDHILFVLVNASSLHA